MLDPQFVEIANFCQEVAYKFLVKDLASWPQVRARGGPLCEDPMGH